MGLMIKAKETHYAGCRFRSRLEAKWAVFFDHLGVGWDYEPEGYPIGEYGYLPDFWLPSIETWFEVKGKPPTDLELEKINQLEVATGHRAVIAFGSHPFTVNHHGYATKSSAGRTGNRGIWATSDYDYAWCICPWCGKPGIEYEGRGARVCGPDAHDIHDTDAWNSLEYWAHRFSYYDKAYSADHPRIIAALTAARSARFEHGESG